MAETPENNNNIAPKEAVNSSNDGSYNVETIQVLKGLEAVRKRYNLTTLLEQSKSYPSIRQFALFVGINENVLAKVLCEAKILALFPGIHRSKATMLNHFKVAKELQLFSKSYDLYLTPVRKLGKNVKQWDTLIEKNPFILLNQLQHDLIVGSLMGDSSLRKRKNLTYFRSTHSEPQKEYLIWQYNQLNEFIKGGIYINKRSNRQNLEYSFNTLSHPIFNFYYNLFYKNGRKGITKKVLELLNPFSLAVWVCDDGSYCIKQDYIILCTNSFTYSENKLIRDYFKDKWGLEPTIGFRDKKYYYLRFKKEDTIKVVNIIRNFIPVKELLYKIGEQND